MRHAMGVQVGFARLCNRIIEGFGILDEAEVSGFWKHDVLVI